MTASRMCDVKCVCGTGCFGKGMLTDWYQSFRTRELERHATIEMHSSTEPYGDGKTMKNNHLSWVTTGNLSAMSVRKFKGVWSHLGAAHGPKFERLGDDAYSWLCFEVGCRKSLLSVFDFIGYHGKFIV